jgi:hypothetical protein
VNKEQLVSGLGPIGLCILVGGLAASAIGCGQRPEVQAATVPVAKPKGPELKMAPATPIDTKRAELGGDKWDPAWDLVVEKALPAEMLSSKVNHDVKPFCPRFGLMKEADKRAFWAYFFQALAGAEAGLKPTTDVRHTEPEIAVKDDVTKRMVRSEGLLQLTYMDADRYGCDFDWEADKSLTVKDPAKTILRPDKNLQCGVKILDNQLIAQGRPLLSTKSYWSTLRPGMVSYDVFLKQMTNVPLACKVDQRRKANRGVETAKLAKPAAGKGPAVK